MLGFYPIASAAIASAAIAGSVDATYVMSGSYSYIDDSSIATTPVCGIPAQQQVWQSAGQALVTLLNSVTAGSGSSTTASVVENMFASLNSVAVTGDSEVVISGSVENLQTTLNSVAVGSYNSVPVTGQSLLPTLNSTEQQLSTIAAHQQLVSTVKSVSAGALCAVYVDGIHATASLNSIKYWSSVNTTQSPQPTWVKVPT